MLNLKEYMCNINVSAFRNQGREEYLGIRNIPDTP